MARTTLFIRLAPILFVMIWSTGFIAAKYSMENADPFVFLCLRFSIAAAVLLPLLLLFKFRLSTNLWQYRHDWVTGALLHAGYLGFVFWPIKSGVPSGIVAIIVGIQPIITTVLSSLYIGESLEPRKLAGLLIGFFGVNVVIIGKYGIGLGSGGGLESFELGLCVLSLLSISVGVFYQKKFCHRSQLLPGTFMQYVAASIVSALFALVAGEAWRIDWTPTFAIALSWQVLGLSIGAIVLLMLIIQRGEAGRASSMFYLVSPLVVLEAHFLFGETLGMVSLIGMVMCVLGVYFVNRQARMPSA